MKKINWIVFGTRPELIKLFPVVEEIKKRRLEKQFQLIYSGQHASSLKDLLLCFSMKPRLLSGISYSDNLSLNLSQTIKGLSNYAGSIQKKEQIVSLIAQGDTITAAAAASFAFLSKIPFYHIEAGLRTGDTDNPFPEEYLRRIITLSSHMHFAPTRQAKINLLNEGVPKSRILVTGNTIVDALHLARPAKIKKAIVRDVVVITCHRRENQGSRIDILLDKTAALANSYPQLKFVWICHQNPIVKKKIRESSVKKPPNFNFSDPLPFKELINLYGKARMIITDSGGIQEEVAGMPVPVLIVRQRTERNEIVASKQAILVGGNFETLEQAFKKMLNRKIIERSNPFGDGKAARHIVDHFQNTLLTGLL
jgi:UDP-N-acetylglucosamine 2-epimerase (non-hydrolysing)